MGIFVDKNWIPYALIIIMGLIIYIMYDKIEDKNKLLEQAKANSELNAFTTVAIQEYNEERFKKIDEIYKSKWKKGKQHGSF